MLELSRSSQRASSEKPASSRQIGLRAKGLQVRERKALGERDETSHRQVSRTHPSNRTHAHQIPRDDVHVAARQDAFNDRLKRGAAVLRGAKRKPTRLSTLGVDVFGIEIPERQDLPQLRAIRAETRIEAPPRRPLNAARLGKSARHPCRIEPCMRQKGSGPIEDVIGPRFIHARGIE